MIATRPKIIASNTAPLPAICDIWIDTSGNKPILKWYNGQWEPLIIEGNPEIDLNIIEVTRVKNLPQIANVISTQPYRTETEIEIPLQQGNLDTGEWETKKIVLREPTGNSAGVMIAADKTKLNRITTVLTGSESISKSATEIRINHEKLNATTNAITDSTVILPSATTTEAGLMSAEDKTFLDSLKTPTPAP